ncbi:GNAT family N-acetyltransferase [Phenylobacterium sp.]|uniref:GNAT family N-acetyltransferase n=1 Tax=Phenylobacterium sp. TaxID=1871053 RepID=UPI0035B37905
MAVLDLVDEDAQTRTAPRRRTVTGELADSTRFSRLIPQWEELVARAAYGNVAMHPAVADAAAQSGAAVLVALAWSGEDGDPGRRLVGAWIFTEGELFRSWTVRALVSPPDRNLILGAPVIDRAFTDEAMAALVDAIAADRALPRLLHLREFPGGGEMAEALRRALVRRGGAFSVRRRLVRPKLTPRPDPDAYLAEALSPKRRGGLRRCRRRLEEMGRVEVTRHDAPDEVRETFEAFLVLEASGWKGEGGTALVQRSAPFVRRMVGRLAESGRVTIWALRLDGRPVAMEVLLHDGNVVYGWKSAYDETLRSLAPGFLLLEHVTRHLLGDASLAFADMSNNREFADTNGVAAFWTDRHEILDVLVALGPREAALLQAAAVAGRLRSACGEVVRRLSPRSSPAPQAGASGPEGA